MRNYYFGIHTVSALLQHRSECIKQLFLTKEHSPRLQAVVALAKKAGVKPQFAGKSNLDVMASNGAHQGVVAECTYTPAQNETGLENLLDNIDMPFFLLLDEVQDPHNLGACLRTANGAGVHGVIAPKNQTASLTPVVRKVACGAAELVPFFQVTNLKRTMKDLQARGIWCYGLAGGEGVPTLHQTDLTGPIALVMGNEANGLRKTVAESCDGLLAIPMCGEIESLNVSVATGVALYEVLRQRAGK